MSQGEGEEMGPRTSRIQKQTEEGETEPNTHCWHQPAFSCNVSKRLGVAVLRLQLDDSRGGGEEGLLQGLLRGHVQAVDGRREACADEALEAARASEERIVWFRLSCSWAGSEVQAVGTQVQLMLAEIRESAARDTMLGSSRALSSLSFRKGQTNNKNPGAMASAVQ